MNTYITNKKIITESGLMISPIHTERVQDQPMSIGLTTHICSGNMQGSAQGEVKADHGNYQFGELILVGLKDERESKLMENPILKRIPNQNF